MPFTGPSTMMISESSMSSLQTAMLLCRSTYQMETQCDWLLANLFSSLCVCLLFTLLFAFLHISIFLVVIR